MYNVANNTTPSTAASTPSMDNMDQQAVTPGTTPQIAQPQQRMVQVPEEVLAGLMRDVRSGQIAKKVKDMGNEYTTRRNTLIIRKAGRLYPDLVSDEEVVAYYDLYKMREAVTPTGKKINITDDEVEAYLELWTGSSTPSLEAVENLIASRSI